MMLPDLGKYAAEVLSAYAASLVLLAILLGWTWRASRRARRALQEAEQEAGRDG